MEQFATGHGRRFTFGAEVFNIDVQFCQHVADVANDAGPVVTHQVHFDGRKVDLTNIWAVIRLNDYG